MIHEIQAERDVLARLRSATKALHMQIDSQLPLARRDADVTAYTAHVQLLQAWLRGLAPALAVYADGPSSFASSSNQTSLDLLACDLDAANLPARRAPAAHAHPALERPAFRWGIQYVIEGSYMGAGMLHKQLAPVFCASPMHFFSHVAAHGKARWARFTTLIAGDVHGEAALRDAEAGAIHAFEYFMQLSELDQKSADDRTRNYA